MLVPGEVRMAEIIWTPPSDCEPIKIYVVVDPNNTIPESIETANNIASKGAFISNMKAGAAVAVGYPAADQVIIDIPVKNTGTADSGPVVCKVYKDNISGVLLFNTTINNIPAGQTVNTQFTWNVAAMSAGKYSLVVSVDPNNVIAESDETDNIAAGSIAILPDLQVEPWSLGLNGTSASAAIRNIGPKSAAATTIQVIYSGQVLGQAAVAELAPMASTDVIINLSETVRNGRLNYVVNSSADPNSEISIINNTAVKVLVNSDFDGNGKVSFKDLALLVSYWLQNEPSVDVAPPGGDGIINLLDFALFAENWLAGQ
jgi:subtilase family serine protease